MACGISMSSLTLVRRVIQRCEGGGGPRAGPRSCITAPIMRIPPPAGGGGWYGDCVPVPLGCAETTPDELDFSEAESAAAWPASVAPCFGDCVTCAPAGGDLDPPIKRSCFAACAGSVAVEAVVEKEGGAGECGA